MDVREHISLATLTTMKVGGSVATLADVASATELAEVVLRAKSEGKAIACLGGGSNVVASDDVFDGVVVRSTDTSIEWEENGERVVAMVGAGVVWDVFVRETVARKLFGIENLSGIPGSVGAAPVQNIGAYGCEVSSSIHWVEALDTSTGKLERFSNEACDFKYRDSMFKKHRELIITRVAFMLHKNGQPNITYQDLKLWFCEKRHVVPSLLEVREAVLAIRAKKFPDLSQYGTAGSFFTNPIIDDALAATLRERYPELPIYAHGEGKWKCSAGWLIDKVANMRGVREGNVGTWPAQALVLVNYGGATKREIDHFASMIIARIYDETTVTLQREVVTLDPLPITHDRSSSKL